MGLLVVALIFCIWWRERRLKKHISEIRSRWVPVGYALGHTPASTDTGVNRGQDGVNKTSFNYKGDNVLHGNGPVYESSQSYELHEDSIKQPPIELS